MILHALIQMCLFCMRLNANEDLSLQCETFIQPTKEETIAWNDHDNEILLSACEEDCDCDGDHCIMTVQQKSTVGGGMPQNPPQPSNQNPSKPTNGNGNGMMPQNGNSPNMNPSPQQMNPSNQHYQNSNSSKSW